MKVAYISDLHLEFRNGLVFHQTLKPETEIFLEKLDMIEPSADILILAGDICNIVNNGTDFLKYLHKWDKVLYVFGNHEYYGSDVKNFNLFDLEITLPKNVEILNNNPAVIGSYKFYGGTGWYPKPKTDLRIRDNTHIANLEPWVYEQHLDFENYLGPCAENLDGIDVVISHHLPVWKCVQLQYIGSWSNEFFVSGFEDLVDEIQPKFWIHGHTHSQVGLIRGSTRILANPVGYPHEVLVNGFSGLQYFDLNWK